MQKLVVLLFAMLPFSLIAQTPAPAPAEKNDPEAQKVLDKVRKKYETWKTIEVGFSLSIEVPGQAKTTEKGTVAQSGDKFRLEMKDQTIVSDGKTTWVYVRKNNEVQITDAEPGGENGAFLTPRDLLRRYQKGDFLYAITDKVTEGGKQLTLIEFKPKDRKSEYSKLRVAIDEKAGQIAYIRAFARDGSRYTFSLTRQTPNKTFTGNYFQMDTKQYPGARVEDLRM
ncbi:MAG: outer membrane lipoprotein carrier protein LolA [Chitinophagales bacterium]|nr:outer membrane lipoprotein carrier protein LolA [Chitinophagales bacterium]